MSAARHYPGAWGSWFWIVVTAAIICSCCRQVGTFLLSNDLPFESDRWDIRAAWILIRGLGILFLSFFLISPPNNEFFGLVYETGSADFSLNYFNAIIGAIALSTGPFGMLLCLVPLHRQQQSQSNLRGRLPAVIFTIVVLVLLVHGLRETMNINGLIHVATTGIEQGMKHPAEMELGMYPTQALDWNQRLEDFTQATNQCLLPAFAIALSLAVLTIARSQKLRMAFLLACLVSNSVLIWKLFGIYNNELASLNNSWSQTIALPGRMALISLLLFCCFCGCLVALRSSPPQMLNQNRDKLSSFNQPIWLLLVTFIFSIVEIYVYTKWNPFSTMLEALFGNAPSSGFFGLELSPSSYSPVQLGTVFFNFSRDYFYMIWVILFFLLIVKGILAQLETKQELEWITTTRFDYSVFALSLAWAISLVPLSLFLGNYGFASCLDHQSFAWQFVEFISYGEFEYDSFSWIFALLVLGIGAYWVRIVYFQSSANKASE